MEKLLLIVAFLFLLLNQDLIAKEKTKYDYKTYFNVAYCKYPIQGPGIPTGNITPSISGDFTIKLGKVFSLGPYFGYGCYNDAVMTNKNPVTIESVKNPITFYGIKVNTHILPLFLEKEVDWVDLYFSPRIGGFHYWKASELVKKIDFFEFGFYGGVSVYPIRNLGMFYEIGYGNYIKWRTGLSIRI